MGGQKGTVSGRNASGNIRREMEETNGEDDMVMAVHT